MSYNGEERHSGFCNKIKKYWVAATVAVVILVAAVIGFVMTGEYFPTFFGLTPEIVQGLSTAGPLLFGLATMLVNNWVASYREDKHFYETRFLDVDNDPESDDTGYFKDASGKLIPIIVTVYSFGACRKDRYVKGFEVMDDGKHGLPFKMSLKKFRTKEIRRPRVELNEYHCAMVRNLLLWPAEPEWRAGEIMALPDDRNLEELAVRISQLERSSKEINQIIIRDFKKLFAGQNELLALNNKFSAWEQALLVAFGKLKARVTALETTLTGSVPDDKAS